MYIYIFFFFSRNYRPVAGNSYSNLQHSFSCGFNATNLQQGVTGSSYQSRAAAPIPECMHKRCCLTIHNIPPQSRQESSGRVKARGLRSCLLISKISLQRRKKRRRNTPPAPWGCRADELRSAGAANGLKQLRAESLQAF